MNEVTKKEDYLLLSPNDVEMIRQFDEVQKRYKVWLDSKREMFEAFLDEQELDSYTQDGTTIYKTKPYKKKQVDVKRMKEEGIYDLYSKDVWVKGSIRVQVNYDD